MKYHKKILLCLMLISILTTCWVPSATAGGAVEGLFSDVDYSAGMATIQKVEQQDQTIVRSRYVNVNTGLFKNDRVGFNLFNNVSFIARKSQVKKTWGASTVWTGRIEGIKDGSVTISYSEDGSMFGTVRSPGGDYQIRGIGNGLYGIYEIDQCAFPDEAPPIVVAAEPASGVVPEVVPAGDACSVIDVLVVYTPAVANASANIINEINTAIQETNDSYANSGVTQRVRLVHAAQINYTESGDMGTDLSRLSGTTDGYMDNVHALRNTYGADVVSLWLENGQYCGIGYFMSTVSASFESSAFTAVARSCATGYYSFGHELGHNMSAHHDWFVNPGTSPYPYNHGYVNAADRWRTIMAYNSECSSGGFNCTRLKYWSNPNVLYNGNPMGVPAGSPNPADNRLTLNNTACTVANFRQSVTTNPTVTISVDKPDYISGETLTATVNVTATSTPTVVDAYVRATLPDGSQVYYDTWTGVPTPVVSSWTVANIIDLPLFTYTFSASDPAGRYVLEAYFTQPGTSTIIGTISSASFNFTP